MLFYDIGLTLALSICVIGTVYRVAQWSGKWTSRASSPSPSFGLRLRMARTVRALALDVLLLARSGRKSVLRWLAHCFVFFGFMGLLLFHAMDETITANFFFSYESTLDPWQFLRNLFGAMTLIGLALMVYRRARLARLRLLTSFQDWAALLIVGCIVLSGFFLEASKIMSPAVFDRMTDEYFVPGEVGDLTALKAYWAHEYGVVFTVDYPMDAATLELGASLDEESCVDCHSNTATAFVSRPLATALGPVSFALNTSRADQVFWYFHVLFCFIALAALPFGKFFHPVSTPINLVARQGRRDDLDEFKPSDVLRGIGMDACTRCGECSLHCSVGPVFTVLGNQNILPSEKLISLKRFQVGGVMSKASLTAFAEGSRICTECLRCTDICPSGINLQDLWNTSKARIAVRAPSPTDLMRKKTGAQRARVFDDLCKSSSILPAVTGLADNSTSYWACVQCTTCTSVCPVVAVSEDPSRDLDLLPQQIMNLLRMGLKEETLGARMVWSCTTCYKCQEHCPQNIRVADVLYELRNTVAARVRDGGASCEGNGESL
ncbi:4Fe-4S dicluster domain-containing protein [uncultured Pseudodesulfovibrio sp.]|uniref:4Fe-4S dicluster domain-containing protein n=1 Tax=uncultured Pseudodesulfovibrio sp. TaxID=2035858 RepID=UPI0029C7CF3A|nr:4Fe-4S dicluster domain-containing protein [uncultured Pseudodesulfovibrio sp.]